MRPEKLNDKKVIDTQAKVMGEVAGIEIDTSTWKVTHLCINLSDDAIEALGYKRPFIGRVLIDIPVETVEKIQDVVTLSRSTEEVKNLVERHI